LADLQLAIQLQGLDLKITGARKTRIALLPKQIAEIERALDAHQRKLDADRARAFCKSKGTQEK